jgi:hypothetical protein
MSEWRSRVGKPSMHKGHCSDSYYVLARYLGRFARSMAAISLVFRVYVKVIIDPWIYHLQDHPMGCNPNKSVHILRALHPRSGVAIPHVLRKLQSSPDLESIGARISQLYHNYITSISYIYIYIYITSISHIYYIYITSMLHTLYTTISQLYSTQVPVR